MDNTINVINTVTGHVFQPRDEKIKHSLTYSTGVDSHLNRNNSVWAHMEHYHMAKEMQNNTHA